jgi:hypothetical protein
MQNPFPTIFVRSCQINVILTNCVFHIGELVRVRVGDDKYVIRRRHIEKFPDSRLGTSLDRSKLVKYASLSLNTQFS